MASPTRRLILATAAASALLAACDRPGGGDKPRFQGVDITGADFGQQLALHDGDGKLYTLADFKGKVVVLFFGYTQCPDVCPTTLLELAEVRKLLGADGQRVQGVFVSLDPERDTPEVLKAYVASFGADFIGLRGSEEETRAAAKEFKIFYSKVPGKTENSYTVDHTAGSYVLDAQGRIRLLERYAIGADKLAADLKILLAEGAS
ncbi:MAG TPA: SCO family protein [Rubrivivax sp.]|nr:SCO family protein [Burkholderiales bacterium]HNT38540.1 SCO family protein [Rubrivivax sp.]